MIQHTRGQALVYIVAMLVPISLLAFYTFNSFTISNEKSQLQNTVDAVAYSVATVEARDLNFKAYTNRAMVANQVAVGQAVSLVSWARWLDRTAENLGLVTSWIPYLNAATRALSRVVDGLRRGIEAAIPPYATIIDSVVINGLMAAQLAMHQLTVGTATTTARTVALDNVPI